MHTKFIQLCLFLFLTSFTLAHAQWPTQPVTLIVGYTAGGPVDSSARIFAKHLSEIIKQPVIVENKPGAAGMVGAGAVYRAKPDGHTLYFVSSSTLTVVPIVQRYKQFDTRTDFGYIAPSLKFAYVMVTGANNSIQSFKDLVSYAKLHPNKVLFGSAGYGAFNHLAGEMIGNLAGVQMMHMPYKGNSDAMQDVIAGKLTFMFDIVGTAKPLIDSGKVRPLVVISKERHPFLPNVPALSETGGVFKDFEVAGWLGVITSRDTPQNTVAAIRAAVKKVNTNPQYIASMEKSGYTVIKGTIEGVEFQNMIKKEYAMWEQVVSRLPKLP